MPQDALGAYLKQIGRHPLLAATEEIELARQVQAMVAPLPGLSESELARINAAGVRAKNKLIQSNLRLVVAIAKKYQNRGLEIADLVQEGALGLERGAMKFDPSRGYKFSTYAYWWIRQAISRAVAEKSRTIRLPIHVTEKLNKVKNAYRQLSQQGSPPTKQQLAEALDMEPAALSELMALRRGAASLDSLVGAGEDTPLIDLLPALAPDDNLAATEVEMLVERAGLSGREYQVLALRYGFEGDALSLSGAGDRLDLSREAARKLEQRAMRKLRAAAVG
jgi:RNA polymerase nonessential primary-like sigma factor